MSKQKHTECRNCALALYYPGVGFAPCESYTCSLTGREKQPHGYCDEAEPGTPQVVGAEYDIDISADAVVGGFEDGA